MCINLSYTTRKSRRKSSIRLSPRFRSCRSPGFHLAPTRESGARRSQARSIAKVPPTSPIHEASNIRKPLSPAIRAPVGFAPSTAQPRKGIAIHVTIAWASAAVIALAHRHGRSRRRACLGRPHRPTRGHCRPHPPPPSSPLPARTLRRPRRRACLAGVIAARAVTGRSLLTRRCLSLHGTACSGCRAQPRRGDAASEAAGSSRSTNSILPLSQSKRPSLDSTKRPSIQYSCHGFRFHNTFCRV
jgi:hypothetical protein